MRKHLRNAGTGVLLSLLVLFAFADDSREPTPFDFSFITYLWVMMLSALGGIVNFSRKIRDGHVRAVNLTELVGEIMTSAFAGLLTFWLCKATHTNDLLAAVFIGISGHMGSRAIFGLEKWAEAKFPQSVDAGPGEKP